MKKLICTSAVALLLLPVSAKEFSIIEGAGDIGKSPSAYNPVQVSKSYPLGWWARTKQTPLKVQFSPDNVFRLLPRSEVQVSGEGAATSKFRRIIKLNAGKVDLELKNLQGSRVEVETPTAICGAVGTEFTVNADNGHFAIREGAIFANAKSDSGFKGERVSGEFTLAPGRENAYSEVNVAGTFSLNGAQVANGKLHATLAKAKGGQGQAALYLYSGNLSGATTGAYLMNKGALESVDPSLKDTHSQYMQATKSEGSLNLKKESLRAQNQPVPDTLEQELRAATKKASELRKKLFLRRIIRDTAKENARETLRQQNTRSFRPQSSGMR